MSSELEIEKEIVAKGLDAPRLTPAHIDSVIVGKTFTMLPSLRALVCQITLKNGCTVEGFSYVVDANNYDQELGEKISFGNARAKIWELEGYLLHQRRYEETIN